MHAGDALSVCFNTVAVLFLLEVDNITFDAALSERLRSVVEEMGHVELSEAQTTALARTKPVHIVLIVATVLGAVAIGGQHGGQGWLAGFTFPFLAFGLGDAVEVFDGGRSGAEVCKRVTKTVGAMLLGFAGFTALNVIGVQ